MTDHRDMGLDETMSLLDTMGIDDTWVPLHSIRSGAPPTLSTSPDDAFAQLPEMSFGNDATDELRFVEQLGAGGMGRVELAFQRSLRREVAVKILHPEKRAEASYRGRMLEEAYVTGVLTHPNIIPVYSLGFSREEGPLLVMKRVEGTVWRELIHADRASGLHAEQFTRHVEILMQVCHAVQFAHSRGFLHLDIKPENVMVGDFGEIYLVDWGVALAVDKKGSFPDGWVVGTPAYMAPEMTNGVCYVDERSDVFLLGACLHELLTGEPRHHGDSISEVMLSVVRCKPYPFGDTVPRELADLCNRACHADVDQRFATVGELRDALASFLRHRASHELLDISLQRSEELHRLLTLAKEAADDAPERYTQIQVLAAECRFGFQQSLREWPKNERAIQAFQSFLEALIAYEIQMGYAGAAQSLIAVLPESRPSLEEALALLKVQKSGEKDAKERLLAMEKDRQLRDAGWGQSLASLLAGFVLLVLSIVGAYGESAGYFEITHKVNLWFGIFLVIMPFIVQHFFADKIFNNLIRKQILQQVMIVSFSMLAFRVIALQMNTPVPLTFAVDLLLWAVFGAFFKIFTQQDVSNWPVIGAVFLCGVLVAFWPTASLLILGIALFVVHVFSAWLMRPHKGEEGV